ncbi:DJ-1/PfpI family protein [Thermodesulfovibrio sp. TK110]
MMKKFFIVFLLLFILINLASAEKNKSILMIIASQNFRDEELLKPKEIFEKRGFKVTIASSSLNTATGMLGAKITPNLLINKVNVKDYDAVVFVGGTGATEYFNNPVALKIAQETIKQNKVLAAICIAPRILAEAGVLQNRKSTVWSSEASALKRKGAIYTGEDVTVDGKVVTASGPHAAEAFATAILKLLK